MEDFLELLFTVAVETVDLVEFKNPQTRTRAMTVIFSLLFVILSGTAIWGAVSLFQQGSIAGTVVLLLIALAVIAVGAIIIVRGHKTNWASY